MIWFEKSNQTSPLTNYFTARKEQAMRRNYSKYLDDFCTTYGLSGAQVARMVGMSEDTIQNIRRGEQKPKQATKNKLNRFILNYKKENPMTPVTSQETQTDIVGIDSRTVAEWTGKNHFDIMRDIRQYSEYLKNADLLSTDFLARNDLHSKQWQRKSLLHDY